MPAPDQKPCYVDFLQLIRKGNGLRFTNYEATPPEQIFVTAKKDEFITTDAEGKPLPYTIEQLHLIFINSFHPSSV